MATKVTFSQSGSDYATSEISADGSTRMWSVEFRKKRKKLKVRVECKVDNSQPWSVVGINDVEDGGKIAIFTTKFPSGTKYRLVANDNAVAYWVNA